MSNYWEILAIGGPLDGKILRITDSSEVPDSYRPWKEFAVHSSFQRVGFKRLVSYNEYTQLGVDSFKYSLDHIISRMSKYGVDMRTYSVKIKTAATGDLKISLQAVGRIDGA